MAEGLYGFASASGIETGIVRLGGMGLGNLLFSWARCAVFCKNNGATQIYTTWAQIKKHCWTHWEPDKRLYADVFHPLPGEIHGVRKLRLLYSLPKVEENDWNPAAPGSQRIVVFRDLRNYFLDIPAQEYEWVKKRFAVALNNQKLLQVKSKPHIGVHIRMGDKPAYNSKEASATNMQLPLSWYIHVIESIAAERIWDGEIGICSDADEDQLRPVLQLPNVRLVKGKNALEDLNYLAQSQLLIGSFSTFSQWAAYFSGGPSIWHPDYDRKGGLGNGSFEMTMSQDRPADRAEWKECMELLSAPAVPRGIAEYERPVARSRALFAQARS
jgi:hypothetical protein